MAFICSFISVHGKKYFFIFTISWLSKKLFPVSRSKIARGFCKVDNGRLSNLYAAVGTEGADNANDLKNLVFQGNTRACKHRSVHIRNKENRNKVTATKLESQVRKQEEKRRFKKRKNSVMLEWKSSKRIHSTTVSTVAEKTNTTRAKKRNEIFCSPQIHPGAAPNSVILLQLLQGHLSCASKSINRAYIIVK